MIEQSFIENYTKGVKMLIAEKDFGSIKDAAEFLGMKQMTLYKIITGVNRPTAAQGINLCMRTGYSANWLFLDMPPMKQADLTDLSEIKRFMKIIEEKFDYRDT